MYIPDISHWIPVRDWETVAKNCPFMISKATQGTSFIDSYLNTFIANCEKFRIPYWLYVFLDPGAEKAQAEFMVKVCKPLIGPFFRGYVLDVERNNQAGGVQDALEYIQTQSAKTMIYTMYAQYGMYAAAIAKRGENCAWWEARYGKNTGSYSMPCHIGADMHQFTSKGVCPGIGNTVDLNRLTGSKELAWFTGESVQPDPKEEEDKMMGLIVNDHKIYFYNIPAKVMYHVPNPAALDLLKAEYKKEYGKEIQYLQPVHFNTLKALIKGKSI